MTTDKVSPVIQVSHAVTYLYSLEEEIKTVIEASVPNKTQNRAALKMSSEYFSRARDRVEADAKLYGDFQ